MKCTSLLLTLFIFVSLQLGYAQLSTTNKKAIEYYTQADNYRVRSQYEQAIALLNMAIAKDKNFVEAYYRLGITYHSLKQYPKAMESYEKGLSLTEDIRKKKVFWYDMGEIYLLQGEYEKAMKVLSAFVNNETQNKQKIDRATLLFRSAEYAHKNQNNNSSYKKRMLSDTVNRFELQYFPVLTADQQHLLFTRRVGNGPNDDEDLVVCDRDSNNKWKFPVSISKNINTRLNEGTCTISADGRKIIFTSCTGRDGIGSCDLYESKKIGNEWTEPKNLGRNVNSVEWESQPSLSADGRTLYFVSDRRAGYGNRDIWISSLNDAGQWTKAVNAGKQVNSQYDEISPFIHVNNQTLYFASNGLPGFGGYDLFYCERDSNNWTSPANIGAPLNDHEDQFSLFITADGTKGYYSHEETLKSGFSKSKIYEIEIPEENQVKFRSNYVTGIVTDKISKQPLKAKVELINLKTDKVESLVESDSVTGEYLIVLTQGAEYGLYINKDSYLFKSYNFNYSEVKDFKPIVANIELEKAKEGSTVVLNNLFFEVDKYDLQDRSKSELQKIVRFLTDNPHLRIEISGHTDNSGSTIYNRELSEKRARSVFQYLVENNISSKRLMAKGYGPDKPIATNTTDEGRQLNRRIEFKVVN